MVEIKITWKVISAWQVHLENFIPEAEILNGAGTFSNIVVCSASESCNSSPNLKSKPILDNIVPFLVEKISN